MKSGRETDVLAGAGARALFLFLFLSLWGGPGGDPPRWSPLREIPHHVEPGSSSTAPPRTSFGRWTTQVWTRETRTVDTTGANR